MDLVKKLTSETKELKKAYLNDITNWATAEYTKLKKLSKLNEFELGATLGFESYIQTENICPVYFPNGVRKFKALKGINDRGERALISFWYHRDSKKLKKLQSEIRKANKYTKKGFIKNEVLAATEHYNNSIKKLAQRVTKKGLELNKIKMTTSFFDPNINTQITDGTKTVNAYTIIASGEVQRPHYRYLVK
jgi:hypothetical protein